MASIWQQILNRIRKPSPPKLTREKPPELVGGHRGTALESLANPDLSEENKQKWEHVTDREFHDFIYNGKPVYVHSSNVVACQYFLEAKQMAVVYGKAGDSSTYLYDNVSKEEAILFMKAPSKGIFVWTFLRVRGSKTAHHKPYRKFA